MRKVVPCLRSNLLGRVAAVALISGATAACSSDSSRFGEDPFGNPFSSASAAPERASRSDEYTGSVQAAPTGRVERAPLAAPNPAQAKPMRGFDSGGYRAPQPEPTVTGSLSPARGAVSRSGASGWSAEGGSTVTLGRGETINTLSQRYGVPANAIMQANNLDNANGVGPGSQIVIPVYAAGGGRPVASAAAPAPSPVAAAPQAVEAAPARMQQAAAPQASGGVHVVASGETLSSVARQYGTTRTAIASANGISPDTMVRQGQKLSVPGQGQQVASRSTAPAPAAAPVGAQTKMQFVQGPQAHGEKPAQAAPADAPQKTAALAPQAKPSAAPASGSQAPAFAAAPAKAPAATEPADNVKTASLKAEDPAPAAAPSGPSFRWPVRGRVISAYGSKANGSSNDGVNIAVPEGTEVKASDDGVVAYAGSELKGFGNLVLIRHENGWVTAYAHNSALNVKRGDTVRRGQIIAKSGATGSVSSPQLHFEVRKGATTVNPLEHLPNA
jgi:murein DD-endopeptidase MepM/ murein hydrolase activator NlpD